MSSSQQRDRSSRDVYRDDRRRPSAQHRHERRPSRLRDVENADAYATNPISPRRPRQQAFMVNDLSSRLPRDPNASHVSTNTANLDRKKSLIRPERRRLRKEDTDYYYRKHAQRMPVLPSTTGNEAAVAPSPIYEELKDVDSDTAQYDDGHPASSTIVEDGRHRKLRRRTDHRRSQASVSNLIEDKQKQRAIQEQAQPPSPWNIYCHLITFWAPNAALRVCGMPQKAQQRAWREKMGLIGIIVAICAIVGYITFGFTETVCGNPIPSFEINSVGQGSMIINGQAYDLSNMRHPAAAGIANQSNPLFYISGTHYGGTDGSFLFQNVNGACKGLITRANGSDIPTDSSGDLAWYFPCRVFNQDGSSSPNTTFAYYNGWACHTSPSARTAYYSTQYLKPSGNVVFSWAAVQNTSRELTVFSGNVLDLSLIRWFNTSEVNIPSEFVSLMNNPTVRGLDITRAYSAGTNKQIAECLSEIIKVGSIDSETVGCIASKVVLYLSLVFILSVVVSKFVLALIFQWFLSRRYAARTSAFAGNEKNREQQIEDWTNDIYTAPPKLTDAHNTVSKKRGSAFLPSTSRFTSPFSADTSSAKTGIVTMTSQTNASKALGPPMDVFRDADTDSPDSAFLDNRASAYGGATDRSGPSSAVHNAVNAQPPIDWQPFGYPLVHCLCLVTAYSEGEAGLRSTLDSIATTEYPNSHKTIVILCDGLVKGAGEMQTTSDIALGMMKDHVIPVEEVEAFSYVAVATGAKRHNMAKVYAGFYDYGDHSAIPGKKQQRVPMMIVTKCGTPDEARKAKPGNRGKRDSQIILMSFLQKVMFDERMTELEYEMFNGLWRITGISPEFYEVVLMVDADTKVFPDSLTHMCSAMVNDPEIMGLCGETKIANKRASWVTAIQVFEYFISHHLAKSFESVFGGVTCLPGCFCMYRIKAPKGGQNYWVPILANPDIVEHYSENVVDTLHKKNLYLLGEDRYLTTLMLKTFPKRKQVFVPQAVCKTIVPESFKVLLSQRRRWINSTIHNLMELVLVRDLCGTFCFSMQFVIFVELIGTLVLPAAITFTFYVIIISIVRRPVQIIPLVLLALILGLPAVLIVLTAHRWSYVVWMLIYLISLPIWNFVLPTYSYWKFDDFSWGETRKTAGETTKKAGLEYEGEFDSSKITMKRWGDFEKERRLAFSNDNFASYPRPPTTSGLTDSKGKMSPSYAEKNVPLAAQSNVATTYSGDYEYDDDSDWSMRGEI